MDKAFAKIQEKQKRGMKEKRITLHPFWEVIVINEPANGKPGIAVKLAYQKLLDYFEKIASTI